MIKLEHVITPTFEEMDFIIEGMRNPMNSWKRQDTMKTEDNDIWLGENDRDLMLRLSKNGPVHRKYLRMMNVYVRITAPLYWWKEFDTYKIGTVANSCSTMHKIQAKEFDISDFSAEHLFGDEKSSMDYEINSTYSLKSVITALNYYRLLYLKTKDKKYWWQMIQLLPSNYNQTRNVMLNYEVLAGMYESRKAHKLDEWRTFCKWIEELPFEELIVKEKGE